MEFNDLLQKHQIDPTRVVVLRHRPNEPELNKWLPWLAEERHDLYNAYQQTQAKKEEKMFQSVDYVASFIRYQPKRALFVGLYSVAGSRSTTREEFWKMPAHVEMKKFGMKGIDANRDTCLCFDLVRTDFFADWKGKLVIEWKTELVWCRRAHSSPFSINAVLEESALVPKIPEWDRMVLKWDELDLIPTAWKKELARWRGIYHIFDESSGKSYVGSAYGNDNLLGRWRNYKSSGHGGNVLLKKRDPKNFSFSILQLVAPNMEQKEIVSLEANWKERLHTRAPNGLNDN